AAATPTHAAAAATPCAATATGIATPATTTARAAKAATTARRRTSLAVAGADRAARVVRHGAATGQAEAFRIRASRSRARFAAMRLGGVVPGVLQHRAHADGHVGQAREDAIA